MIKTSLSTVFVLPSLPPETSRCVWRQSLYHHSGGPMMMIIMGIKKVMLVLVVLLAFLMELFKSLKNLFLKFFFTALTLIQLIGKLVFLSMQISFAKCSWLNVSVFFITTQVCSGCVVSSSPQKAYRRSLSFEMSMCLDQWNGTLTGHAKDIEDICSCLGRYEVGWTWASPPRKMRSRHRSGHIDTLP